MEALQNLFASDPPDTPKNSLKRNRENDGLQNAEYRSPPDKFQSVSLSPQGPAPPLTIQPIPTVYGPDYSPGRDVILTSLDSGAVISHSNPVHNKNQPTSGQPDNSTHSNVGSNDCPAWATRFMSELTSQYAVLQECVTKAVKETDTNLNRLTENVSNMQSTLVAVTNRVIKLESDVQRLNDLTASVVVG